MFYRNRSRKWFRALIAMLAIGQVALPLAPARAGPAGEAAMAKANALTKRGIDVFSQANDAVKNGDNANACELYQNAAVIMENAIFASAGIIYDPDYDKEKIKEANTEIQKIVDASKESATLYCSSQSAASSPSTTLSTTGLGYRLRLFQSQINSAYLHASDAADFYSAKKYVEACTSARLSAVSYAQAKIDQPVRNSGEYFDSYSGQTEKNAASAAADVSQFYCKDPKVAAAAANPAPLIPAAETPRADRVREGLRHQELALAQNAAGQAAFAAQDFARSCDAFRSEADQLNQFLLLNRLYQSSAGSSAKDKEDYQTIRQGRERASNNGKIACDKFQEQWRAESWPAPEKLAISGVKFGGHDYTPDLRAFYAFASEWQNASLPKAKATELFEQCIKAQSNGSMSRACEAIMARYPDPEIESCWYMERGFAGLVELGGWRVPEIGLLFEQLNNRMYCKPLLTGFGDDEDFAGLTLARNTPTMVVKPIPERPR